jgi:ankyrin repeat protein
MTEEKFSYFNPDSVFSENELDNQLFHCFLKETIDKEKILDLISMGANVNAIDNSGNTLLMNLVLFHNINLGKLNLDTFQFLIELGVDINYEDDRGANCLYGACLSHYAPLVELLLKVGANPNCAGFDEDISLLDWAEFDQHICGNEYCEKLFCENDEEYECYKTTRNTWDEMICILKKYGAKSSSELLRFNNKRK